MDIFPFISRHFWAICLAFLLFNYLAAERKISSSVTLSVAQLDAAKRYLRWFSLASTLPWLVMGWGQVVGGVPSVWHYFRPQDRNPYVLAWLASIFVLSVLYAVWVFFADGARKTREYELLAAIGMRARKPMPEGLIKLFAALGPFFVVLWVYLAASMDTPVPK